MEAVCEVVICSFEIDTQLCRSVTSESNKGINFLQWAESTVKKIVRNLVIGLWPMIANVLGMTMQRVKDN